ncbi:MAG: FHA domain-containing protein [Actinobacteria bacterium]|nr:MAG: FHA domain-containing protein [Actinomycetota bacterium]
MPEIILLFGRVLLLGLLYLFLFAVVRTGIGLVSGGTPRRAQGGYAVAIVRGPQTLEGMRIPLTGPLVVGRAPDADIVISDAFVSTRHARISPGRGGVIVEDLGSTNGTVLNGVPVTAPAAASPGDIVSVGPVDLKVEES